MNSGAKKPSWLTKRVSETESINKTIELLRSLSLHTVCEEAECPNVSECFGNKTATFMILGDVCTRRCRFCAVKKGKPQKPDPEEPRNIAEACKKLGLKHVVITSVTRDDLSDGGAAHFALTIYEIRNINPNATIEVLIPDLSGNSEALKIIACAKPDILNHNLETVPRLYETVRPGADYRRSLWVLEKTKELEPAINTKSGLMAGLGEKEEELYSVMRDLRLIDCDILTIGQYLQPSDKHIQVAEYIEPGVFEKYKTIGLEMGFKYVASGSFVRSSYHAAEGMYRIQNCERF